MAISVYLRRYNSACTEWSRFALHCYCRRPLLAGTCITLAARDIHQRWCVWLKETHNAMQESACYANSFLVYMFSAMLMVVLHTQIAHNITAGCCAHT